MSTPISDLTHLLRAMEPTLNEGVYVFLTAESISSDLQDKSLAIFREKEGVTIVAREEDAVSAGLPVMFRAAWITLTVHSDLEAVGLTAAFGNALAEVGISCNVLAAAFHDHIFVPVDRAEEALERLQKLQREGR